MKASPVVKSPVTVSFNVTRLEKRILESVRAKVRLPRGCGIDGTAAFLLRYALIDLDRIESLNNRDSSYAWLEGVDQGALTLAELERKFPVKRRRKSRA